MPVHIQFAYCYDMKIYLPSSTLLSLSQIGKSCFDQAEGRLPAAVDGVAENDIHTYVIIITREREYTSSNIIYKSQEEKI